MTNPRDDLMALVTALQNADWPDVSIGNKALIRNAIERLTEAASRPATQVVDREAVARALCESGKFETGEGTCSLLCMDQLGSVRKKGCNHLTRVHGKLADSILSLLRPAEPVEAEGVGEPVAWRWRFEDKGTWSVSQKPASWVFNSPDIIYEPLYTHPPKSPDTSAEEMRDACELIATTEKNQRLREVNEASGPNTRAMISAQAFTASKIAAAIRQLPTESKS